ncbi:MAG: 6,7-dimethyl-8-ribityllumazine synthase [Methylophilaceae bacterium]
MNRLEMTLQGKSMIIGIVMSRFNEDVVSQLLNACEQRLLALGVAAEDITLATVPGALETPLTLPLHPYISKSEKIQIRGLAGITVFSQNGIVATVKRQIGEK